jgi:predicted house-cleaning noncanonical NTP pyrophosphatase (MazG superfamily)
MRGGGRPRGGPRRGGGGGGGGGGRGGAGGHKSLRPPMLLGEPSPSLAKINAMNMAQLTEKIASLDEELARVSAKLERLEQQDDKPEEKIKTVIELISRLKALKIIAEKRLAEKAERKAAYDAKQQGQ